MHFPEGFSVPGFLRTLSQRQQTAPVPQQSCCASFTELRAAWAFPGSQPIRWSSFSSKLPGVRLSQFPLFPCPSPICTFSLAKLSWQLEVKCCWNTLCCYSPRGVAWFCFCHNFTAEKFQSFSGCSWPLQLVLPATQGHGDRPQGFLKWQWQGGAHRTNSGNDEELQEQGAWINCS